MGLLAYVAVVLLLGAPALAQNPAPTLAELKEFQRKLGWESTTSFTQTTGRAAYYRCYYTGKLELPSSYEELRLREGTEAGCRLDEGEYDVFYYRIEAVAAPDAPVTRALSESSAERMAVVVLHEDFHQQPAVRRLPEAFAEAASTLTGFVAAAEFARSRDGEGSPLHARLAREADLFLEKARLVNEAHRRFAAVYGSYRGGSITRQAALEIKARELAELESQCRQIHPEPASFNRCLPVFNNAGLAFDYTYTRYYPLLYELYRALGSDLHAFHGVLAGAARAGLRSEPALVEYFQGVTARARTARLP